MEKKRKRKQKKKNIVKVYVCFVFFSMDVFIYDKIAKIKEEFNILIGSRSIIINLYVSCIFNIRWKVLLLNFGPQVLETVYTSFEQSVEV